MKEWPVLITVNALLVSVLCWVFYSSFWGAPWIPARLHRIRKALDLAGLRPGQRLLDLGSGDGRVLVVAARDFGARARGIEIDPARCHLSRLVIRLLRLTDRAEVIRGDMYGCSLDQADMIVLHLSAAANAGLEPALADARARGATVVSLTFPVEGWTESAYAHRERAYVYRHASLAEPGDITHRDRP